MSPEEAADAWTKFDAIGEIKFSQELIAKFMRDLDEGTL